MQVGILSNNQWPAPFDGSMYSNSGRNLKTWWNFEDFVGGLAGANIEIWKGFNSGAASAFVDVAGQSARPGIVQGDTGTTTTGYAGMYAGFSTVSSVLFGAGIYTIEADIYLPTLSTVAEEYIFRFGFGDAFSADFVDGAYFEYDRLTNVNWQFCNASNSARTKQDTGFIVAAGSWIRLKIVAEINLARFYISNYYIGASSGNFPTGAGRNTSPMFQIVKSAGTTTRSFQVDWAWLHIDLTASR